MSQDLQPPTKKQKIKQNIDLISNVNNNAPLSALFSYDWFLIEIGRLLMNRGDKNLINILILNKSINKRATIVFRNHFFNFKLQKELVRLVRERNWDKVQQIFKNHGESLNPNIYFNAKPNEQLPRCADITRYHSCVPECGWNLAVPLAVVASRLGFWELVISIISHKRFGFDELSSDDAFGFPFEANVLNLAAISNQFQVIKIVLDSGSWQASTFEVAMQVGNFELFLEMINHHEVIHGGPDLFNLVSHFKTFWSRTQKVSERKNCFKSFLDSRFFKAKYQQLEQDCFFDILTIPDSEYLALFIPAICKHKKDLSFFMNFDEDDQWDILVKLKDSSHFISNSAMRCAFLFSMSSAMTELLQKRAWSDQELLELMAETHFIFGESPRECLFLLLKTLSDQVKLEKEHTLDLLKNYLRLKEGEKSFLLLWNDKRVVKSTEMAHSLLILAHKSRNIDVIEHLILFCNLNAPAQFKIIDKRISQINRVKQSQTPIEYIVKLLDEKKSPFELIDIDVRTKCWLSLCKFREKRGELKVSKARLGIKMTQSLFDLSMRVAFFSDSNVIYELLDEDFKQFWNEKNQHLALVFASSLPDWDLLQKLFLIFPQINLSANNNEALITLMNSGAPLEPSKLALFQQKGLKFETTTEFSAFTKLNVIQDQKKK